MKKFLISILLAFTLFTQSASALSTYTSVQTGHNPVAGSILQTDGSESNWVATSTLGFMDSLITTSIKTSNYNAQPNDLIPCDISGGSFTVTLPEAPTDETIVSVKLNVVGLGKYLTVVTSGTDKFNTATGNTAIYMYLFGEFLNSQYDAQTGIWNTFISAATYNWATQFPGIDATTPISNTDISINTTSRVLSIVPPLGYFNIFVDGGGVITRYRKIGTINFPAYTNTSGIWYFYFNNAGVPVTTQVPWTTDDFSTIAPVYRILVNASLATPALRDVAEYVEYHQNTISASDHIHDHLGGAIWESGFDIFTNLITTGSPAVDGSNSVIALNTGHVLDDNLDYGVTNSTSSTPWNQDMGNTTPATLNSTNGGKFQIFTQDAGGLISFLPATTFPFSYSAGNVIEYITSTGTRTPVGNTNFAVLFVYSSQNPRTGEAIKVISATTDFVSLTNARAYTWTDIQNAYPILANDGEIRPLYRLIYESKTAYDVGSKKAALRETQDLRKGLTTSNTASSGSLPASSVTFVPTGNLSSTNVQSALQELDTEKAKLVGGNLFTGPQSITGTSDATQLLVKANATQTNSIFEVQNSSSSPYLKVTGTGLVGVNNPTPISRMNMVSNDGNGYFITDVFRDAVNAGGFSIRRARGTSAAPTTLLADDVIGINYAQAIDTNGGTTYYNSAITMYSADAAHGTGSTPGRITFLTTPASSTTAVERMRISSAGNILIGNPTMTSGKVQIEYPSGGGLNIVATTAGAGGGIGLIGDPGTAVTSGQRIGLFTFGGAKDGSHTIANGAAVSSYATENWSSTAVGTEIRFETATNGGTTRTQAMVITNDQKIGIGVASPQSKTDIRSANVVSDSYGIVNIGSSDFGIDKGGSITFSTPFTSDLNSTAPLTMIAGRKENATSGNYSGYLSFATRVNGGGITEKMRIDSAGNVGIGGTPNTNAILDVQSTTKAVMLPRVTTTQRDAIASPTESMLVYNLTTHVYNFYNGTSWLAI